ncbi:dynein regulatory complex subunit 6-like [Ischnura elegans]|uniref:dynein regulatory complex subunit 6-like n=1 Tax=Ischnura elegans TaxID=197161 RepID=UPI001ED8A1B4|nr:dynein regulatory complex subunit 6-like [Ischnura elegans]
MMNNTSKSITKEGRVMRDSRNRSRYFFRPTKVLSLISSIEQRVIDEEYDISRRRVSPKRAIPFTKLPEEIVIMIFSHLSVKELNLCIAPVCRKWFLFSRHPSLWRELKFEGDTIPSLEVIRLLRQAPQLRCLEISHRADVKVILEEVSQSNRHLERISIRQNFNPISSRLSPYAVNFSTNPSDFNWKSVESIFLDNSLFYLPCDTENNSYIPSSVLLKVLRACRRLSTITLIGIELRSRIFFETLERLPKLKSIDLTVGNRQGAFEWVVSLLKSHVGVGSRSHPLYFHAIYNWYNGEYNGHTPTHYHLSHSPRILSFITTSMVVLDIDAIAMMEDHFEELIKCSSLQALHLYNAVNITSTNLIKMLTQLPQLVSLRVNQAYRLRSAVLISTFYNTYNSKGWEISNTKLKHLSLVECPAIDDASIHAIASRHPQLEHLSLAQCHQLTDEGLRCVLCFCHRLRSMNLWDCSRFVGRSLMYVPTNAPHLELLMVGSCRGPGVIGEQTEKHINMLKEAMPHIKIHDSARIPKGWTLFKHD